MKLPAAVMLGGAIGALLRLCVGVSLHATTPTMAIWLDTIVVNTLGCGLFGWMVITLEARHARAGRLLHPLIGSHKVFVALRETCREPADLPSTTGAAFWLTGLCGGFTTFSAFAFMLMRPVLTGHSVDALAAVTQIATAMAATVVAMLGTMQLAMLRVR